MDSATQEKGSRRMRVMPLRRITQALVLAVIVLVPVLSQNPQEWSPSRLVQGMLPPPAMVEVSGDTWAFTLGDWTLMHPLAVLETLLSSRVLYLPALLAVIVPLLMTLLAGRVFCSWMCPAGFVLELVERLRWRERRRAGLSILPQGRLRDLRYIVLGTLLFMSVLLSMPLLSLLDPPHALAREFMYGFTHAGVTVGGAGLLVVILLLDLTVARRLWCSKLCPSGGGLSLLGAKRVLNITMDEQRCIHCTQCDAACPYDLKPMGLAEARTINWMSCDNCGLCRDACPTGAIAYGGPSTKRKSICR